jgi:hypothetical protein
MRKRQTLKLKLTKETLRDMVPEDMQKIAAGAGISCGALSACDCSAPNHPGPWTLGGTQFCTLLQY